MFIRPQPPQLRAPLEVFGPEHLPFSLPTTRKRFCNRIVGTPERSENLTLTKRLSKRENSKGTLSLDVQSAMEALVRENHCKGCPLGREECRRFSG